MRNHRAIYFLFKPELPPQAARCLGTGSQGLLSACPQPVASGSPDS